MAVSTLSSLAADPSRASASASCATSASGRRVPAGAAARSLASTWWQMFAWASRSVSSSTSSDSATRSVALCGTYSDSSAGAAAGGAAPPRASAARSAAATGTAGCCPPSGGACAMPTRCSSIMGEGARSRTTSARGREGAPQIGQSQGQRRDLYANMLALFACVKQGAANQGRARRPRACRRRARGAAAGRAPHRPGGIGARRDPPAAAAGPAAHQRLLGVQRRASRAQRCGEQPAVGAARRHCAAGCHCCLDNSRALHLQGLMQSLGLFTCTCTSQCRCWQQPPGHCAQARPLLILLRRLGACPPPVPARARARRRDGRAQTQRPHPPSCRHRCAPPPRAPRPAPCTRPGGPPPTPPGRTPRRSSAATCSPRTAAGPRPPRRRARARSGRRPAAAAGPPACGPPACGRAAC